MCFNKLFLVTIKEAGHPKVKEVLDEVWEIHKVKNQDYSEAGHKEDGDVFSNFRACEKFDVDVLSGILVRMSDKWERACNLHAKNGDNAVPGESLRDAFLDLIGYAAIYLAELDEKEQSGCIDDIILDASVDEVLVTSTSWYPNEFFKMLEEEEYISKVVPTDRKLK